MKLRFNIAATAQTEWEATEENLGKSFAETMEGQRTLGEEDIWEEISSIVAEKGMRSFVYVVELVDDEGNVVDKAEIVRGASS